MKKIFTLLISLTLSLAASAQLNCDNTLICDNFDSYVQGALGPQADHWSTWSGNEGGAEDGIVNIDPEFAFSGNNSLYFQGQGGPQDVLLLLGDQTAGNWRLDFKMWIFDGQRAYWNMQKCETDPGGCWGQEVTFTEDGTGSVDAGGADAASFTFPHGEWFDVTQFYDLDNDRSNLFIAGQAVHSWAANLSSQGTSNGLLQIGAIDFYATNQGNHLFYIDDVRFTELPGNGGASRLAQVSVDMSLEDVAPEGVFVAGSFNGWTPEPLEDQGNGIWQGYAAVEDVTDYEYKFVNGNSFESGKPDCGVDDTFGGYNRAFFVDTTSLVLETICFNQCVDCSEVSSASSRDLDAQVVISPNPASGEVVVKYDVGTSSDLQLRLLNLMGQSVLEMEIGNTAAGTERIDLAGVPTGVYILQLHDGQRQVSRKLVVE